MRIFGLDFSSSPASGKMYLATGNLIGPVVQIESVARLRSHETFADQLAHPGPWVMGCDFPFGLPAKLVEGLGWPCGWSEYVAALPPLSDMVQQARNAFPGTWIKRKSDLHHGAAAAGNMVNPPMAKMFVTGAPHLLASGADIVPCRRTESDRHIVEIYPKLLAETLLGPLPPYKLKGDSARESRVQILDQLSRPNPSGLTCSLDASLATLAVQDPGGDILDSILAAIQAAVAWERRHANWGIPNGIDANEGWIVGDTRFGQLLIRESQSTQGYGIMEKMPTIALIAHDGKKPEMVMFAQTHKEYLSRFDLIATGSTGKLVTQATGLPVKAVRHGPAGGDVQIASEIIEGRVQAVFFFVEPMDVHPHDPDIQTLMRICNIENIPMATNSATADFVIKGFTDSHDN